MKLSLIGKLLTVTTTLILATPTAHAQTTNDRVLIEVEVKSLPERKDLKGTSTDTVTQNETLQITLRGKAKSPEIRTGKWFVYGRDLQSKAIVVLGSGEFVLDLSRGPQKVETDTVTTTSTPEHFTVSGGGRRARAKKVAADGVKYIGYSVVVHAGDTIVGEAAYPRNIRLDAEK